MTYNIRVLPHLSGSISLLEAQLEQALGVKNISDDRIHDLTEVAVGINFLKDTVDSLECCLKDTTLDQGKMAFDAIQHLKRFYGSLYLIRPMLLADNVASTGSVGRTKLLYADSVNCH